MIKSGVPGGKVPEGHGSKREECRHTPSRAAFSPHQHRLIGQLCASLVVQAPGNTVVLSLHHVRSLISSDTKKIMTRSLLPEDRVEECTHQACSSPLK